MISAVFGSVDGCAVGRRIPRWRAFCLAGFVTDSARETASEMRKYMPGIRIKGKMKKPSEY